MLSVFSSRKFFFFSSLTKETKIIYDYMTMNEIKDNTKVHLMTTWKSFSVWFIFSPSMKNYALTKHLWRWRSKTSVLNKTLIIRNLYIMSRSCFNKFWYYWKNAYYPKCNFCKSLFEIYQKQRLTTRWFLYFNDKIKLTV